MKTRLSVLAALCAAANLLKADTIAQWNFNSAPADANTTTGSTNTSLGAGSLRVFGGTTFTFASGHTNDPAPSADNTAINVSTYNTSATSNKAVGIRFDVSTVGYTNIVVSWSQRESATASRYHRFQYSADGATFVDAPAAFAVAYPNNQSASLIFTNFSQDLSTVAAVGNDPSFAFQIVYETEVSATGSGAAGYIAAATGSSFSQNGTVRFDMMTISGTAIGVANSAPTISSITNVSMRADTTYPAIPVTIGDAETPADSLALNKFSTNPGLFPDSAIALGGADSNRTVTLTPAPGQSGSANITLTVIDGGGKSNNAVFAVTVIPTNTAPTISVIANQGTTVDTPSAAIPFTIGDLEIGASNLTVAANSSNTTVLPQAGVVLGGSNANRTITLTPGAGQTGNALVSISVSDGVFTTNRTFILSVLPSAGTLFYEPFNYADGPLITNSLGLWQNHSGGTGELDTASQVLYVTADNSEDVNARLRGEPFTPASGTTLYYSLRLSVYNLPTPLGDFFAHLKDNGNGFSGKLFVTTTNAPLFYYRIGVATSASFPDVAGYAEVPVNLPVDQTNLIVVRYNVGTAVTTVWLNPATESDPSYTASDAVTSTNTVTQFAIRESRFQGDLYVDDIRVATTFNEALGILPSPSVRLKASRSGNNLIVSWPASATGYVLQTKANLSTTNWGNVAQPPVVIGSENVVTNSAASGNAFFRLKN